MLILLSRESEGYCADRSRMLMEHARAMMWERMLKFWTIFQ
jgi:hypothetical protein